MAECVLLAKIFDPDKHYVAGQLLSEKLDGQRMIWDGGVTTGMLASSVPWAYNPKPGVVSTGLWTRNFKVIHAPKEWLEAMRLPTFPLDGEAYLKRNAFQETESILRTETPSVEAWRGITYRVFDIPSYSELFGDRKVKIFGKDHYISGVSWITSRGGKDLGAISAERAYWMIPEHLRHKQERLPIATQEALEVVYRRLEEISSAGGEGLMIRRISSIWHPKRSDDLLKVKKFYDAECTVQGYTEGKGRLQGMCGALKVTAQLNDNKSFAFELGGLTDDERRRARELFPIGTTIRFKYNDRSNDGIPKHARYWR